MPIRTGLGDEHASLLQHDEEQGGQAATFNAADEGTFQLNGNNDSHDRPDDHHVRLSKPGPSNHQRSRAGKRDYGSLWKSAAKAGVRAAHRKEISESLKNIDTQAFTSSLKSDDELKSIKNKKIKRFYEAQNARISSWFEVDAGAYACVRSSF